MLQKEAFKSLSAKEKEEYISNLLKKIVQLNPDGVTISQIKEAAGLNYSTIWHHLEVLSCTAQSHKISRGNVDIYYPIGKATHLNDYDKGKVRYALSTVENDEGNFLCIYEKRADMSGSDKILRGTIIPFELIDNLIINLNKIKVSKIKKIKQ